MIRLLLEEVVASSQALGGNAPLRVEMDLPASLPAVDGDEVALRRVFQNLIGNAMKYGAAGGWIGIRARLSDGGVQVSVRDKGIGISSADQVRIFEPFYRASEVIDARIQGAGLGLSLVQRIVEAHGGRVTVTSTPGAGSEFTVTLPSVSLAPDQSAAHARAQAARSS